MLARVVLRHLSASPSLANNLEAVHRVRWVRRNDKWFALSELLADFDKHNPQPKPIPVLRLSDIA